METTDHTVTTLQRSHTTPRRQRFGAALLCALALALLLSGCSAVILPESWPGLTADGRFENGRYVDARYLYVTYRNTIFRIDLRTAANGVSLQPGQLATDRLIDWAASAPNNAQMFAPPALAEDGTLYVGAYNHSIYAFSPNASPRTQQLVGFTSPVSTGKIIGGALIVGDRIYVGQGDHGLRVYDATTGAQIDFYDMPFGVWDKPVLDAATNTLYVPSMDQHLYALTADTLDLKWRVKLDAALAAAPLLDQGVLYQGTLGGTLYAIDTEMTSGNAPEDQPDRIINSYKAEGWLWGTAAISESVLYFGDMNGWLYAMDANTWTLRGKVREEDTQYRGSLRGRVAVADGKVLVASASRYVIAYDAGDLRRVWISSPAAEDRILSDVIVVGDDVIITTLSENSLVNAYNLQNGARNWFVRKANQDDLNRITLTPPAR
jgi:outer membrane protein assembly factor BamB